MKLSEKVNSMALSPIRKFTPIAKDREQKGTKIYYLNIGQPDIETPSCFVEAIQNFDEDVIEYANSQGLDPLLDAIVDYFAANGMDFDTEDVMVTNGGSEALSMVYNCILNPGENILIPEPYYTNYDAFVAMTSGYIKPITTSPEDGYFFADAEKIESCIDENTRAICLPAPGNPTGRTLTLDDIRLICEVAEKHDLWIIADEVYREFVYDGAEMTSFGMLPEFADRVVIVDSISKRYSSCGARIGFVVTKNKDMQEGLMKIAQGRLCVPTLEQMGATELFRLPKSYYDEVCAEYEARRDAAYEEISKIPGVVCRKPGGSFYLMAKLPIDNAEDFLLFMLEEFEHNGETVMFTPAEGFYATEGLGKEEIRIAYVLNAKDMARSAELIRLGIEAYNNR